MPEQKKTFGQNNLFSNGLGAQYSCCKKVCDSSSADFDYNGCVKCTAFCDTGPVHVIFTPMTRFETPI